MKHPLKYLKGIDKLNELRPGTVRVGVPEKAVYDTLESLDYVWTSQAGQWTLERSGDLLPADAAAEALIQVRVSGPADQLLSIIAGISIPGTRLVEQSRIYPNRYGDNARVYLTFVRVQE
ncbi:MAG: hypothetical protein SF162_12135 [bacterium]|nr:hypothetical protein [bacterium]